jgi:hypothetical protein
MLCYNLSKIVTVRLAHYFRIRMIRAAVQIIASQAMTTQQRGSSARPPRMRDGISPMW